MVLSFPIPAWFIQISILIELIITVISMAIAFTALKIYSICRQRELKIFGLGFLLISVSYILWSGLNLLFLAELDFIKGLVDLNKITNIGVILLFGYFILFLIGLATLAFMTLKIKGKRAYLLIVILSLLPLILNPKETSYFFITSLVLLFFIAAYYGAAWFARRKTKRLISFTAFSLLFLARVELLFASKNYFHYIIGNVGELIAYLLLLINLVFIIKNGKKKK